MRYVILTLAIAMVAESMVDKEKMVAQPMKMMPPYYQNTYWIYDKNDTRVSAYNREKELCCAGHVFPSAPNSYHRCCGSSQFDTTRQKCCDGVAHHIRPGFDCCGTEYFAIKEAICCTSPVSGNYTLKNFTSNILGNADAIQNTQCCGLKLYDSRSQICCTKSGTQVHGGTVWATATSYYNYNSYNGGRRYNEMMQQRQQMDYHHYTMIRRMRPNYVIYKKTFKNSGCCKGKLINKDDKTCPYGEDYPRPVPYNGRRGTIRPTRIYPQPPMYGYCDKDRYNMQTHICCTLFHFGNGSQFTQESKLHEKTFENTGCCGTETFDHDTQICCNNRKIHLQNEEATLECCGNNTFDTVTEQCCDLANTVIKLEALEEPNDSCCGEAKMPYNSNTQMCCGNKVLDIPKTEDKYDRRMSSFYCCWNPESNHEPSLYNSRTEMCCDGVKNDNKGQMKGCCGNKLMDWSTDLCCDGNVYNKSSTSDSCCGKQYYNIRTHLCCDFESSTVVPKKSRHDSCCGNKIFDYNKEVCCRKNMYERPMTRLAVKTMNQMESAVFPKSTPSTSCCGMQVYEMDGHQCCGNTVVQYDKELCCSFRDADNSYKSIAVSKVSVNSQCCGQDSYDPDHERCCNQTVVQAGGLHLQCCGSSLYDSEQQLCCNGKVHNLGEGENLNCCGQHLYDGNKQICCRGAVKDVADPRSETCCYENTNSNDGTIMY